MDGRTLGIRRIYVGSSSKPSPTRMPLSTSSARGESVGFYIAMAIDALTRDTVSSVGITWGPTLPETTTGMHHVCFFRHALSLDEGRGKFLPEYANGGSGPTQGVGNVKEVWFDGSHSDMYVSAPRVLTLALITNSGGGNTPNLGLDKFGPALRFVVYEGVAQGLRVKSFEGAWAASEHTPSLARWSPWWLLEIYPFRRNTYNERGLTGTTRWYVVPFITMQHKTLRPDLSCLFARPHRGAGRIIQDGQRIHRSVLDYMKTNPGYQTMASTADGSKLTLKLLESTEWKDRIEDDVWSVSVEGFLRELKTAVDSQGDIAVEESKAAFFTEVASSGETSPNRQHSTIVVERDGGSCREAGDR